MANEVNSPRNAKVSVKQLIDDTTSSGAVSAKFDVLRNQVAVLRSTNLDGSAVIGLYYGAPDGTFTHPSTYREGPLAGQQVTLTPTYPEAIINAPGSYKVQVDTVATTTGVVFVLA
jgi:hypothetical protein